MSKKRKTTSNNNTASNKTKNTEIYTPDTAPINFLDVTPEIKKEETVEKKVEVFEKEDKKEEIVEEKTNSATIKEKPISKSFKKKTEKSISKTVYNMAFLKNKATCRIIGKPQYRGTSMLSMKELINLVLENTLNKYIVIVSEQTANTIIDFILNAPNSDLETELSTIEKENRIKVFRAGLKMYKL